MRLVVNTGQDGTARLWQLGDGATQSSADAATLVAVYSGHGDSVAALAAAPGGSHFASGGWDGAIHVWRTGGLPGVQAATPGGLCGYAPETGVRWHSHRSWLLSWEAGSRAALRRSMGCCKQWSRR